MRIDCGNQKQKLTTKTTMKILSYTQVTLVITVVVAAVWAHNRRVAFEAEIEHLEMKLLQETMQSEEDANAVHPQQSYHELPACVQRYFRAVFSNLPNDNDNSASIRSLKMNQTGKFSLNDKWYPFEARQTSTTHTPGFFWNMDLSMIPSPPSWMFLGSSVSNILKVRVYDAYVPGKGGVLQASLGGFITLAHLEGQWEADVGEMLRWLAEALLYPTVLLPQENVITWKAVDGEDHHAIASLSLAQLTSPSARMPGDKNDTTVEMLATFDPDTHWVTTLECQRPRGKPDGTFEAGAWRGYVSDYRQISMKHGRIWVPSHMECGWVVDGELELYFKGDNFDLQYTTGESRLESSDQTEQLD